nr:immunoglobulin light chain junction region [Macaca mulatta]
CQHGYGVTYSF